MKKKRRHCSSCKEDVDLRYQTGLSDSSSYSTNFYLQRIKSLKSSCLDEKTVHLFSSTINQSASHADPHPVVVGGVWVFITGDDLRRHPVRRPNEGVPPADGPVQLSADTEVH